MSSSASEIREIQDMIEEFEALLTEGDLTSEEEIEIEDAILELNEELSVLRGNDTVPTASVRYFVNLLSMPPIDPTMNQASSSSVALPSPTNVIQSATMIPKAIE